MFPTRHKLLTGICVTHKTRAYVNYIATAAAERSIRASPYPTAITSDEFLSVMKLFAMVFKSVSPTSGGTI
jgi:hypothetical protein